MTDQEILRKMQEHVVQEGGQGGSIPAVALSNSNGMFYSDAADLSLQELESLVNEGITRSLLVGSINPRPQGLHNKIIQLVKKVMRRFLVWYIRPVQELNVVVLGTLQRFVAMHQQHIVKLNSLTADFEEYASRQHQIDDELQEIRRAHIYETLQHQEAALRRLEHRLASHSSVEGKVEQNPNTGSVPLMQTGKPHKFSFDYAWFQERFRGSEALIRDRQRAYLKHFLGRTAIMDVGCGRGEFLELLREHGVSGTGVETNNDAVLLCKEKGLEIIQGDIFEVLESRADSSLGGIFSSQVIEHLPVELQLRLLDLCYRKLKSGSPVLIETINPECVFALVRNFYLDPTHVRPVPPELLQFAMESKGFNNVELSSSAPVEHKYVQDLPVSNQFPELQKIRDTVLTMNQFLFGYQDYAIVGWRP